MTDSIRPGVWQQLFPDGTETDFREAAAERSRVRTSAGGRFGEHPELSLCVAVEPDEHTARLRSHARRTAGMVVAFALCVPVAVWAIWQDGAPAPTPQMQVFWISGIALLFVLCAALLVIGLLEPRRLRKLLAARPDAPSADFPGGGAKVMINHTPWHGDGVLSVVPADTGLLWVDRDRERIVIDGYFYRYQIQAADIVAIGPVASSVSVAVRICYRIDDVELDLAVVWNDRSSGGASDPVMAAINASVNRDGAAALSTSLREALGL